MEIINNANCEMCENNNSSRQQDEICDVFNLPITMYIHSTRRYGCNYYVKDVNKMEKLPEETKIKGRDYVLWEIQYSQSGAEFSAEVIGGRVPKSFPEILKLVKQDQDPEFGVYVRKVMNGD